MKRDIESLTKNQLEVKNAISEMNTLEGIKRRLNEAEENKVGKIPNQNKKNKDGLRELWDNMKCNNIHIIGVPEGEESQQGIENLFEEIMIENFLILVKEK